MKVKHAVMIIGGTVLAGGLYAFGSWYYKEITFRN